MVLQRGRRWWVELEAPEQGEVFQKRGGQWHRIGRAPRFRLLPLPAGGPYTIALQVRERSRVVGTLTVRDVLVGDVWIAAGQSNMQGYGLLQHAAKPHPKVRAFYMDDQWRVARDPIHEMAECVDPVHIELLGGVRPPRNALRGVGPAVSFAREMLRLTGVPQGIVACAHGGTSLTQWDPQRRDELGHSLYGATYRRLRKNGGYCAGVIWYQGESDAAPNIAAHYTTRMRDLIHAFRRDADDPRLPVVLAQLGRVVVADAGRNHTWNLIQEQQRQLPLLIPRVAMVATVDLELDDHIHIAGDEMDRLGRRMAQAMHALRTGRGPRPIEVAGVRAVRDPHSSGSVVYVSFRNVAGRLRSDGRPHGFSILAAHGEVDVYRTVLRRHGVELLSTTSRQALDGARLYHGRGTNPYCNIRDEAGRALPVFGPVVIGRPRALSDFVREFEISELVPVADALEKMSYPHEVAWKRHTFPGSFADRHLEIETTRDDRLAFYRCRFRVAEPMRLNLLLGYDGPVKVWVDGREVYQDPQGTNPAVQDAHAIPLVARHEHEVVVALGTNRGRAWGIFLRFERCDVSRAHLRRNLPVAMPEIIR